MIKKPRPSQPIAQKLWSNAALMVVLVAIPLASCEVALDVEGAAPPAGIVNGQATNYQSFKGAVGLYFSMGYSGTICTATLIDPEVLLTAGHCVYLPSEGINAINNVSSMLVFGGADMDASPISYPGVSQIIKHAKWTGNISGQGVVDLAMIKLNAPITSIENYALRSGSSPSVGEKGKVVGYGITGSNNPSSSGVHRVGTATVLNVGAGLLEIGNPSGTCQGDSGGPFFTQQNGQWVLTGVTSFGTSNTCLATGGGYDVDVTVYRNWIDATMNTLTGHGLQGGSSGDTDIGGDTGIDADTGAAGDTGSGADPTNPCSAASTWSCNPVSNQGCGANAACDYGVDNQNNQGFYCFTGSTAGLGQACDSQNGPWCTGGLVCGGGTCIPYCCSAADCGSGQTCLVPNPYPWTAVKTQQLGVCAAGTVNPGDTGNGDTGIGPSGDSGSGPSDDTGGSQPTDGPGKTPDGVDTTQSSGDGQTPSTTDGDNGDPLMDGSSTDLRNSNGSGSCSAAATGARSMTLLGLLDALG